MQRKVWFSPEERAVRQSLSLARSDCAILAGTYLLLGTLLMGWATWEVVQVGILAMPWHAVGLAAGAIICLLTPGAAYLLEAIGLAYRRQRAVDIGPMTVILHGVSILLILALVFAGLLHEAALAGAMASLFFMPASLAFLIHTRRVRLALEAHSNVHGFSPLIRGGRPASAPPVAVTAEPVEGAELAPASPGTPATGGGTAQETESAGG